MASALSPQEYAIASPGTKAAMAREAWVKEETADGETTTRRHFTRAKDLRGIITEGLPLMAPLASWVVASRGKDGGRACFTQARFASVLGVDHVKLRFLKVPRSLVPPKPSQAEAGLSHLVLQSNSKKMNTRQLTIGSRSWMSEDRRQRWSLVERLRDWTDRREIPTAIPSSIVTSAHDSLLGTKFLLRLVRVPKGNLISHTLLPRREKSNAAAPGMRTYMAFPVPSPSAARPESVTLDFCP